MTGMDENVYAVDTTNRANYSMRRVQFIEIHEQSWFPSSIRDQITDALQFGFNLIHAYEPVVPLLQKALNRRDCGSSTCRTIVDLCSGGGGPWFDLASRLQSQSQNGERRSLQIWLTDKYPSVSAIENLTAGSANRIAFYPASVDAMNVPRELRGFRTMFTSFHHFAPDEARDILQDAVDAGEGIGIFEITRRTPSAIGIVFAWVALLFFGALWIRPFRWSRLLWTYLIPVIPFVLVVDGIVSCLRSYRLPELQEIVKQLTANQYQWEIGEIGANFAKPPITYLIGYPPAE
jgi:hypothetical protein